MLERLQKRKNIQLLIGFFIGILFGFLLDKGGATEYTVIMHQLLLRNFRVLKIIFTAVVTGMIGVHLLVKVDLAELQPKAFQWKSIVVGGLIFGIGFALLGYCPGTAPGAVGTGSIHALFGVVGILIGAGIFASLYPYLTRMLHEQHLKKLTIPEVLNVNRWVIILLFSSFLVGFMYFLEVYGF